MDGRGGTYEAWRWWARHSGPTTISVIEPKDEKQREGPVVPFGFARVLAPDPEPAPEREPLLWEGD